MKNAIITVIFLAKIFLLSGCGLLNLPPTTADKRSVTSVTNSQKEIIFLEPVIWGDRPSSPTRAVRFPKGVYKLEAEDSEYFYFKSSSDLEYRIFKNNNLVDRRFMPGGFYLSKNFINMKPAGAYLNIDKQNKILTWVLGRNFLNLEGKLWKRNY